MPVDKTLRLKAKFETGEDVPESNELELCILFLLELKIAPK